MLKKISLLIYSIVAPFLLVLLENWLPYPLITEEILKFFIIFYWLKTSQTSRRDWIYAGLAGLAFAISESILYTNNIILSGKFLIFPERLILTTILHSSTLILMFFGIKQGKIFGLLSLLSAILLHWGFNTLVVHL
jgi:hypothetical protein